MGCSRRFSPNESDEHVFQFCAFNVDRRHEPPAEPRGQLEDLGLTQVLRPSDQLTAARAPAAGGARLEGHPPCSIQLAPISRRRLSPDSSTRTPFTFAWSHFRKRAA